MPGRALLVIAAVLGSAGLALGALAIRPSNADTMVLDAAPATAVEIPETVPLLPPPTSRPVPASDAAPETTSPTVPVTTAPTPGATSPTTSEPPLELSPLADLLGVPGSAIPPAIEPRVRPQSVTIDDIELWGPVRAVGLRDDGALEVPDETEIGWYRYGSSPGRPGATVLAAHVSWNGAIGPFNQLAGLDPGARVDVQLEDDTARTYEVVERAIYDKDELPRSRIWRTTGDETLVLITCGGSFNPDINRYRENVVVYAVPVATKAPVTGRTSRGGG